MSTDNGLNYNNIPGANSASLVINNPTVSMSGYLYRVVVTNGCGNITSNAASLTVNKADANVVVTGYNGVYDGASHGATGSATGIGGVSLSGLNFGNSFVNVPGGVVNWTFINPNYLDEAGNVNIVITKANAVISVTPYSVTYDANPHTATGTATGIGGVALAGLDLSGTTHTNAGTYTNDPWSFTDVTGNYNNAGGSVNDSIGKVNAVISVTPYSVTYDANPHTATGTATGVEGETLVGLDLSGTTHTSAGTYTNDPWSFTDVTGNYNNASGSVNDAIGKANATISVTQYSVTYDANPHTATGTAKGVLNEALAGLDLSGTTHTSAGTYNNDPWTFTDATGNYNNAGGSVNDAIGKANATISVTPYSVTYDANPHTATGTATGVEGETLVGLDLSGTTHTNAGTYNNDPWTFTDATGNYNNAGGSVNDAIGKANAVILVTPYSVTYDANPHTATGTATGVLGEALAGLDLSGTTHTNAGTYNNDPWSFTDVTGNYNNAGGSVNDAIGKANAVISVTPYSVTYDANPHTATGTATGVLGEALAGLDLSGTTHTNAGTYNNDPWSFTDVTGNYNNAGGSVNDAIGKANAVISVTPYSVTYDANPHTATGTATGVEGETLAGLDLSGTTHTSAGTYNNDPWSFTDVTGNYNNASGSVNDVIGKANATISVTPYSVTYDANPHTATGTATGVLGEALAGLDLSGTTHTNAGTYTNDPWSFTDATGNYNNAGGSVNDVIGKANATISVTPYSVTYDANPHTATGTATGVEGETLAGLDLSGTTHTNAGTYTNDPWSFTDVTGNYNNASGSVNDAIGKANATISVTPYSVTYDANPHTATGTATGVEGETLAGLDLSGTTHTNAGTYNNDPWSFTDVTGNYNNASGSVNDAIGKANAVISVTPYSVTYDANPHTATGTATGVEGETLVGLDLSGTTHTSAGTYNNDPWTFTDVTGNYNNTSGSVNDAIGKANATIVITPYSGVYDSLLHTATGTATGVAGANLNAGLSFVTNFRNVPGGSTVWNFNGGVNYNNVSGSALVTISQRNLIVSATGVNKIYDGTTAATVNLSSDKIAGDALTVAYSSAQFINPNVGTWTVNISGITKSGADQNNYNLTNTTAVTSASITSATTALNLQLSAASVRYMDNLTFTAKIIPLNSGSPLTGTVKFTVNGVDYGSYPVVPIPGASDGSVQAMAIKQIVNLPGNYIAKAEFLSSNANYTGSYQEKPLQVIPRNASPYNATGFYTGDLFAWTTGPSTSTATLTMTAVIKDNNSPTGDVRGAKVSFFIVNGSTMSPIASAQNLPVGLIDVSDGSVGSASAIVQLNIGSANAASFQIAVKVTGAYENNPWATLSQTIVTVTKPVPGGYIVGGGNLLNSNSSGYVKGAKGQLTGFQFDVQFNNKLTNPQGKAFIYVSSYNKPDGTLDNKLHTYIITTNAISLLNITLPKAQFSSKANIVEQLDNGTTVSLEGGAAFQMAMTDSGNSLSQKTLAITLNRKAGGVWFSSNWSVSQGKTVEQVLNGGSLQVRTASGSAKEEVAETDEPITDLGFKVKIYPNPSNYEFTFKTQNETSEPILLKVFDISGKLIKQIEKVNEQEFVFGHDLPKGIYLLTIEQGLLAKTMKLIKE
ncbi:YDG domain-containing protein [Flavobacterium amniphilum]|uniref:YDG domain-containing protein n=1 Tax=Flavobacterium amniphilum TaxID=1834035 RepID=UPI00202A5FBC|nr:YDG domain-containing protein [Flavobacterium amniphilum]MCL9805279.1 YDG domain-containing protein [Flavobacterium amniphilum]